MRRFWCVGFLFFKKTSVFQLFEFFSFVLSKNIVLLSFKQEGCFFCSFSVGSFFVSPSVSDLVAKNSIRSSWFQHPYAGMSLGFARTHRSSDAYVRCLLCRCDLKVGSRGISTFLEHCCGVIHHRLDCLVGSRRGLFLRRRTGAVMSATEAADMGEELRGLSVPEVELCPAFSVREVFSVEARGGSIWDSGVCELPDNERSLKLFLCFVVDSLYRGGDVTALTHLWDSVATTDVGYQSLLSGGCRKEDVIVSICYMYCMCCMWIYMSCGGLYCYILSMLVYRVFDFGMFF